MEDIKIRNIGICNIVSSGYDDRYVVCEGKTEIEIDRVKYQVDHDDFLSAYFKLTGIEENYENSLEALKILRNSPSHYQATTYYAPTKSYQYGNSSTSFFISSRDAIAAGVKVATGFIRLNDLGIADALKNSENLTKNEWVFIKQSLEKINEDHAKQGKPAVEINIPEDKI